MTNHAREWIDVGSFDSVTDAACRIREIEGYPVTGLFLEMHVDTAHGSDQAAFGQLEHTGRRALYVVKRQTS